MGTSITKVAGLIALLAIFGYALVALQGPQGIPGLLDKRHQIRDFEKKNADLARQIEEQRARINRFTDGNADQELPIRQRLKLVKPDEKVFILQDPPASGPTATPTPTK